MSEIPVFLPPICSNHPLDAFFTCDEKYPEAEELYHSLSTQVNQYNKTHDSNIKIEIFYAEQKPALRLANLPENFSINNTRDMLGTSYQCFTSTVYRESETAIVIRIQEVSPLTSLQKEIEELADLAEEFRALCPWQVIRILRPAHSFDLDLPLPPLEKFDPNKTFTAEQRADYAKLSELRVAIIEKRNRILSTEDSIIRMLDSAHPLGYDFESILNAQHLLHLLTWAYQRTNPKTAIVTYKLPFGGSLESYTAKVDPSHNALVYGAKILDSNHGLVVQSGSTVKDEASLKNNTLIETVLASYPSKPENKETVVFHYYLDVFGVPQKANIPGLQFLKAYLKGLFEGKIKYPYRMWFSDFYPAVEVPNKLAALHPAFADRYIDLEKHERIFQFLHQYREHYEKAARLLNASHPDIKYENLLLLLYANTFIELFWMNREDPWQDKNAAGYVDSKLKEKYESEFDRYLEEGATFGYCKDGEVYNLPWRLASLKVPIEAQGFGVNQVIPGLLLKSGTANQNRLWDKYFPGIDPDTENAVALALDPEQSIRAIALIYDQVLTDLKSTVFADPSMRLPDDVYPMIPDKQEARDFYLLTLTRCFKTFPEMAINYPDYFPWSLNSWNIDYVGDYFLVLKQALGIQGGLSSMEMNFIPSKGNPLVDWLVPDLGESHKDALILVITPRQLRFFRR